MINFGQRINQESCLIKRDEINVQRYWFDY
jgi:hypothetical protein